MPERGQVRCADCEYHVSTTYSIYKHTCRRYIIWLSRTGEYRWCQGYKFNPRASLLNAARRAGDGNP